MIFFFSIFGLCLISTLVSYFLSRGNICWKEENAVTREFKEYVKMSSILQEAEDFPREDITYKAAVQLGVLFSAQPGGLRQLLALLDYCARKLN